MATYKEIQDWVKKHFGFVPKPCWIAHAKELFNIPLQKRRPRQGANGMRKIRIPDRDKLFAIQAAFEHFRMIPKQPKDTPLPKSVFSSKNGIGPRTPTKH